MRRIRVGYNLSVQLTSLVIGAALVLFMAYVSFNGDSRFFPAARKTIAEKVTYQGHDYLFFFRDSYCRGVVHDPDCEKCSLSKSVDQRKTSTTDKKRTSKRYLIIPSEVENIPDDGKKK